MSKEQDLLFNALANFFNEKDLKKNLRPNHLKNQATGKNYEIDIYISRFNVGIEYQGAIHFKNIGRYNNDSDSSRNNDIIKSDLVLNHNRTFALVEIFPEDLKGNTISNVKDRINNTILYYYDRQKFLKVRTLELLRMYLDYNIKIKGIMPGYCNLYDQINKKRLPLCYSFIISLNKRQRNIHKELENCADPKCECKISILNNRILSNKKSISIPSFYTINN